MWFQFSKKNERVKCDNYRPISLLSNLSKVFERAMHTRLYEFFDKNKKFYELQFGFRKKHNTEHAVLEIIEKIKENLDNKTFVCGVFIDLQKAFDTVDHSILLKKMHSYGVTGMAYKLFESYLTNRYQRVVLQDIRSGYKAITCGVPQGSILGPLLFLIYINDMHCSVKSSTLIHFADDTNLLNSDKSLKILKKKVNEDLSLIYNWLCANKLSLNVVKTEFIIFKPPRIKLNERITLKINRTVIFESKKIKYLGLIVDDKLTWRYHNFELRKRLSSTIGILTKLRKLKINTDILISIYYSLFQSYLGYGLNAWGNSDKKYLDKIRILQNKCLRVINGSEYHENTDALYKKFKILKFEDLLKLNLSTLMWEFDNGLLPSNFSNKFKYVSEVHTYGTRAARQNKLSENISINTNFYGKTSLRYCGPKILNSIKNYSYYESCDKKETFRRLMKQMLFDTY